MFKLFHSPIQHLRIILIKGVYFGWMLSFPFHGPVLRSTAPLDEFYGFSLPLIFGFFHALAFFVAAFVLPKAVSWQKLMISSLITTIILHLFILFSPATLWPPVFAALGVCSALFILGWSVPFSFKIQTRERLKIMASVIILANLVYVLTKNATAVLKDAAVLPVSILPLFLVLLILLRSIKESAPEETVSPEDLTESGAPVPVLSYLTFLLAGLYFSAGLVYTIIRPSLAESGRLFLYFDYTYIPYILVLVFLGLWGYKLRWELPVYLGISLLGLSFILFSIAGKNIISLLITAFLLESSYALLDLFSWTLIGSLASVYGSPYLFFGIALGGKLFSIIAGEWFGHQLLLSSEMYRVMAAFLSASILFLLLPLIPRIKSRLNTEKALDNDPSVLTESLLLPGQDLTTREKEIISLLLEGFTNKVIAEKLYISENTLKTHLKNIYRKYGVKQKRELLSRMIQEK